jgi:hypothetical protein
MMHCGKLALLSLKIIFTVVEHLESRPGTNVIKRFTSVIYEYLE